MKRLMAGIVVMALSVVGFYSVADAATPEDAKVLLEKAVAYLMVNKYDTETVLAEISNPAGQFVNRDVYAFVIDFNGVTLADGGNPGLVGINRSGLKDTSGKYFVKEMIETAKSKGEGWVEYMWLNRDTKRLQPKITYVKRIKGMDAFMAAGVLR
jgi:cytochrome c